MNKEITFYEQFNPATQGQSTVIVGFANLCSLCKKVGSKVEVWAEEYESCEVYRVDVDQLIEAVEDAGISNITSIVVYKSGLELEKVNGMDMKKIRELFTSKLLFS